MNTSVYYILVIATAIVTEVPPQTPRSAPRESSLENTQLEKHSEIPATILENHTTVTMKIENIIPSKSALLHSSLSVSRLIKSFNSDYDPFFIQNIFMPSDKRHKTFKVVSFRRNRLQPRITLQNKEVDSTVAEKQSPYNELPDFSIDSEK